MSILKYMGCILAAAAGSTPEPEDGFYYALDFRPAADSGVGYVNVYVPDEDVYGFHIQYIAYEGVADGGRCLFSSDGYEYSLTYKPRNNGIVSWHRSSDTVIQQFRVEQCIDPDTGIIDLDYFDPTQTLGTTGNYIQINPWPIGAINWALHSLQLYDQDCNISHEFVPCIENGEIGLFDNIDEVFWPGVGDLGVFNDE